MCHARFAIWAFMQQPQSLTCLHKCHLRVLDQENFNIIHIDLEKASEKMFLPIKCWRLKKIIIKKKKRKTDKHVMLKLLLIWFELWSESSRIECHCRFAPIHPPPFSDNLQFCPFFHFSILCHNMRPIERQMGFLFRTPSILSEKYRRCHFIHQITVPLVIFKWKNPVAAGRGPVSHPPRWAEPSPAGRIALEPLTVTTARHG
jgi:hypothetical protein